MVGFFLLCLAALADQVQGAFRSSRAEGFVRVLEFKHRLRVCNAYPYASALDVHRGQAEKLTEGAPMQYKTCRDFQALLKSGDKLEFKVGDASAGTFAVSDLPNNDAVMLLVIHRHDTLSTAVSFESHVFANLQNAQVAVIDTYKGKAKATPKIMDAAVQKDKAAQARSEELRYDSVVAVNPGLYDVELIGTDGAMKARNQLVALSQESYVVIRTGVEAQQGPSYPQELVIYPQSDGSQFRGSATALAKVSIAAFALAICYHLW
jgi:hypothetical protein